MTTEPLSDFAAGFAAGHGAGWTARGERDAWGLEAAAEYQSHPTDRLLRELASTIRAVPAPEAAPPAESTACPACDGRGGEFVVNSPAGMFQRWRTCETCAGTGADQAKLAAMFGVTQDARGETDDARLKMLLDREAATIARYDAKLDAADKRIAELEADLATAQTDRFDELQDLRAENDRLAAESAVLKAGRVTDEMVERAGKALIRRQIMRNMRYEQKPWPEDKIIECIEWTWAHRENTGFEADARAALGGGAK